MIFFLARLAPPAGFEVFTDFRQLIEASGGQEPVKAICHKLEFSLRQADRLFAQCLGFSPKTYARITRFQRALAQLMKDSELSLVQLAAACGYYDQSHFVKDFRTFTGGVPRGYRGYYPAQGPDDFAPNVVRFLQDQPSD